MHGRLRVNMDSNVWHNRLRSGLINLDVTGSSPPVVNLMGDLTLCAVGQ